MHCSGGTPIRHDDLIEPAKAKEWESPIIPLRNICATESRIDIRALRPEDRDDFLDAVGAASNQSLYRRFLPPNGISLKPRSILLSEYGLLTHVALIAYGREGKRSFVGGAVIVVENSQQAEVALMVVDEYQGGHRRLAAAASDRHRCAQWFTGVGCAGVADNTAMLKVFRKCGLPVTARNAESRHDPRNALTQLIPMPSIRAF